MSLDALRHCMNCQGRTGVEKNTMMLRGEATEFQSLLPTLDGCNVAMLQCCMQCGSLRDSSVPVRRNEIVR